MGVESDDGAVSLQNHRKHLIRLLLLLLFLKLQSVVELHRFVEHSFRLAGCLPCSVRGIDVQTSCLTMVLRHDPYLLYVLIDVKFATVLAHVS